MGDKPKFRAYAAGLACFIPIGLILIACGRDTALAEWDKAITIAEGTFSSCSSDCQKTCRYKRQRESLCSTTCYGCELVKATCAALCKTGSPDNTRTGCTRCAEKTVACREQCDDCMGKLVYTSRNCQVCRSSCKQALGQFLKLEQTALNRPDKYYSMFRVGECLSRLGKKNSAIEVFSYIANGKLDDIDYQKEKPPDELRAKAMMRAARIIASEDAAKGFKLTVRVIHRFPDTVSAEMALIYALSDLKDNGRSPLERIRFLKRLYQSHKNDQIADNCLFHGGMLALSLKSGDGDTLAMSLFETLKDDNRFRKSGLRDNAIWELSSLYLTYKKPVSAINVLNELLKTREDSYLIGSYEIKLYDMSQLRIGEIYEKWIGDYTSAVLAYQQLLSDFPRSNLRGKALFAIASIEERHLKNYEKARESYRKLIDEYPESARRDDALFRLAQMEQYIFHDPVTAEALYKRLLEEHPYCNSHFPALLEIARIAVTGNRCQDVKSTLQELIVKAPQAEISTQASELLKACEKGEK